MQYFFLRTALFCIVLVFAVTGMSWLMVFAGIAYIWIYTGWEIIIIAAMVDAYFGVNAYSESVSYWYTITTTLVLLGVQLVKPSFTMYNKS